MVRYCRVQTFYRLEHEFYRCLHSFWTQHFYHLIVYLIHRKWSVDISYSILHLRLRLLKLCLALMVGFFKKVLFATFFQ